MIKKFIPRRINRVAIVSHSVPYTKLIFNAVKNIESSNEL